MLKKAFKRFSFQLSKNDLFLRTFESTQTEPYVFGIPPKIENEGST